VAATHPARGEMLCRRGCSQTRWVRVFDMIVDERRHAADLFAGLTAEQLRRPSLCAGWTVLDVAAHLTTFLRAGQAKIYLGIGATAGDIDRLNVWLTARAVRRPVERIVDRLRRGATARTTIPRSGYDPVLTDLVLHDLDVRRPLGLARAVDETRLWVAFHHLAVRPTPGFAMGRRLDGLRLVATDTGWEVGRGRTVRGPAQDLLLGVAGRVAALDALDGDGLALLRTRIVARRRPTATDRMAAVLRVLTHPAPVDRRSSEAVAPALLEPACG
jgi:uncharacterized protein (TIGR03083 family)